jgi:Protein of unknown function (DUF3105)
MASRKEQKEALRNERMQQEQQAAQSAGRKRLIGIVVASILVLGIVAALAAVLLSGDDGGGGGGGGGENAASVSYPDGGQIPDQQEADLKIAMKAAGCKDETLKAGGAGDHTTDPVKYESEPPSIGAHYPEWPDDDIYEDAPQLEKVVHTLEHGRVLIWIRPDADQELLGKFKALYEEDPYHVIMLPRKELKQPFAVTAWVGQDTGHTLRCKDVNDQTWDAIRSFKEAYRDKGPEFVP